MTNTDKNDLNATIGNTVLPAVFFRAVSQKFSSQLK